MTTASLSDSEQRMEQRMDKSHVSKVNCFSIGAALLKQGTYVKFEACEMCGRFLPCMRIRMENRIDIL